jgi:hypothetical protein
MVYMGGLTFDSDNPSKFLKIPNLVAAKRVGLALLARYGLDVSMKNALDVLAGTGNPMKVLAGYCALMRQRDVVGDAFAKMEEDHRDSIWVTILENPAIKPVAEYQVRKVGSLLTPRIANVKLTYVVDGQERFYRSPHNRQEEPLHCHRVQAHPNSLLGSQRKRDHRQSKRA